MQAYAVPHRPVDAFSSSGAAMDFLPAAGKGRNTRVHVLHLEAGGTLGGHEATMRQAFAVISGSVQISTENGVREELPAGSLAIWQTGEWHQTWAVTDSVAVIMETDAELEIPGAFAPITLTRAHS